MIGRSCFLVSIACRRIRIQHNWLHKHYLGRSFQLIKRKLHEFAPVKRMSGESPVILKLDTPEFKAIFTPELTTLASLFKENGYELRIAGGAVRDLLMNKVPHDLDFATTATPEQMKEMFTAKGIRMINMSGEKHGTVTPRINDKENFEVTTLRIDVTTDGRHAEVEFTTDWKLDAYRRDLTINSMFLGLDGTIYDYFSGYQDLLNRRVTFVGDPNIRIKEDYLRILRYFRFHGRIAKDPLKHEESTLQAIREHAEGLKRISGERIWIELKKILEGNCAGDLLNIMLDLGIGPHIGLPVNPNIAEFHRVWSRAVDLKAMTLLASLFRNEEEVISFHNRVKLSAFDRDLGLFVLAHREDKLAVKPLRAYQALVVNTKLKLADAQEYVRQTLRYRGDKQLLDEFNQWTVPKFPVNGNMLRANGVPGGKAMGAVLQKLKEKWIDSDFTSTSEELEKFIPEILDTLDIKKPK
ncbi:CCA tRNA nucleotidyltransferase 1, mitochondrial [Anabrus simplex]|uniref:CCA tRNA nucleotidyltransferase 1, mitochondrial n=1 Tax=Anabrus simplex TaxID=316456 RepID=UPI0034DD1D42